MKKVLFLIHDLGPGGAEKVLVNLVNNMDKSKYDITVHSLFDVGVNKQFLAPHIHYIYSFKRMIRGNSKLMKLLTPQQLHKWLIQDDYDIEIAYLEGPCARIISGCEKENTKLIAWIHREQNTKKVISASFRGIKETEKSYNKFDKVVCVSESVKKDITKLIQLKKVPEVYFNTNESDKILAMAEENVGECTFNNDEIKLIGVGKLIRNKGFHRVLEIVYKLHKIGENVSVYILGVGVERKKLEKYIKEHNMESYAHLMGYQTNPYKFIKNCDLFVCSSYGEGFSTAATEALIVGTPVCTVEVSGMREMLGDNNEYGIVTENNDEALYQGIKKLVENPTLLQYYKEQAVRRGKEFSMSQTVQKIEKMLWEL